jgi:hypothetical protein
LSFAGVLSLMDYVAMLFAIQRPTNSMYYRIRSVGQARLDFDPTSSHFKVIEFVEVKGACVGVKIYSSKTAAWIFKESEWGEG